MSRLFVSSVVVLFAAAGAITAIAGGPHRDFAYGNAGFGAGYSRAHARPYAPYSARQGGHHHHHGGGHHHHGWSPGYGSRYHKPYAPYGGYGRPVYSYGGWYGSSWYSGAQSVYLATPVGGGATFFSGGIVPWPVPYAVPVPYVVPVPWLGGNAAAGGHGMAARPAGGTSHATASIARPRSLSQRASGAGSASPTARSRAARLVADGDRKLVESKGVRQGLAAAASAYGRAAVSAKDDPDIHLRHAIALAAAGRRKEADEATGRAVALDRRLEQRPMEGADPSAPSLLVARGLAILREIGADASVADAAAGETIAILAERWAGRPSGPLAALAGGASTDRD